MIINVWRPKTKFVNNKQEAILYSLCEYDEIYKSGSSGLKVIWKCDGINCKFPNKTHSIMRHHLNINRSKNMYEYLQICKSCQTSGDKNPKYGDSRTWDQVMGIEKSKKMKNIYRDRFTGNANPSKKEDVKKSKNQIIVSFNTVSKIADKYRFRLNNIIGDNKYAKLQLTCHNNHNFDMIYHSLRRGHGCKYCFYESIKIDIKDIEKFEKYSKSIRYLTRSVFRRYVNLIDPNNLKSVDSKKYHIDHIYSVFDGFKNNIDPKIISSHINLIVIKKSENLSKGKKSEMTKEELFERYNQSM